MLSLVADHATPVEADALHRNGLAIEPFAASLWFAAHHVAMAIDITVGSPKSSLRRASITGPRPTDGISKTTASNPVAPIIGPRMSWH